MPLASSRWKWRTSATALVVATLLLSACSSADEGSQGAPAAAPDASAAPAPSGPTPTPSDLDRVSGDDGAHLPPVTFAPDPGVDDVIALADAGRDLGAGEQFAFSAMQFLLDSNNAGVEAGDLDQLFSGEDAKRFMLHANSGVKDLDIDQRFLVEEPGWVRSQWLDETNGAARAEFMVRHRFEIPRQMLDEYWINVVVEIQWVDERWTLVDFMAAGGPRPMEMPAYEKEIWMEDESGWRDISALK